jgi:hypothetical protein
MAVRKLQWPIYLKDDQWSSLELQRAVAAVKGVAYEKLFFLRTTCLR